jgi:hypothetical protein
VVVGRVRKSKDDNFGSDAETAISPTWSRLE